MLVRRELPSDVDTVRAVVAAAFTPPDAVSPPHAASAPGGPGAPDAVVVSGGVAEVEEVRLLDALRTDPAWIPALSMVAILDDEVTGHVVCSRATIGDHPVLALGPIAVRPDRQHRGVGTALMHAVLGAADALDEPLVGLLGDPRYYGRFGFRPSSEFGIVPPDPRWTEHFQIRRLTAYVPLHGTFTYPAPFDGL